MQAYTRARALGLMNARVCVRVCDTQHRFSLSAHMLTVSQCRARRVACRASDKEGDERSSTPPLDLTSNTTGSNSEGQQPTQSRSFSKEARPTTNGINLINTSLTFLVFRLVLIGQGPPVLALWNNVDAADLSPTDSFALLLASDLFQLAVVLGILLRLQRPKSLPQTSQAGDWPARVIGVGLAGGVGSFAALSALPSPEGAAQNTKVIACVCNANQQSSLNLSFINLFVLSRTTGVREPSAAFKWAIVSALFAQPHSDRTAT